LLPDDDISLGVVGTRKMSNTGRQITEKIIPDLVQANFTIISGLARGIDSVAHQATILAKGRTIAVLGNGIDKIYPSENQSLAKKIIESGGAVISEFLPGTPPNNFNFPRRNRIISGMSLGILVVEGKEKSGSLITAKTALEQSREVFAIPGSPTAIFSQGPNKLIQNGEAKLVQNADDIFAEFSIVREKNTQLKNSPDDPIEKKIWEVLGFTPKNFDEICQKLAISPAQISATLTILEMKNFATSFSGNNWVRKL